MESNQEFGQLSVFECGILNFESEENRKTILDSIFSASPSHTRKALAAIRRSPQPRAAFAPQNLQLEHQNSLAGLHQKACRPTSEEVASEHQNQNRRGPSEGQTGIRSSPIRTQNIGTPEPEVRSEEHQVSANQNSKLRPSEVQSSTTRNSKVRLSELSTSAPTGLQRIP